MLVLHTHLCEHMCAYTQTHAVAEVSSSGAGEGLLNEGSLREVRKLQEPQQLMAQQLRGPGKGQGQQGRAQTCVKKLLESTMNSASEQCHKQCQCGSLDGNLHGIACRKEL